MCWMNETVYSTVTWMDYIKRFMKEIPDLNLLILINITIYYTHKTLVLTSQVDVLLIN